VRGADHVWGGCALQPLLGWLRSDVLRLRVLRAQPGGRVPVVGRLPAGVDALGGQPVRLPEHLQGHGHARRPETQAAVLGHHRRGRFSNGVLRRRGAAGAQLRLDALCAGTVPDLHGRQ
ncbi:unnamed protein product, partial [Prorocentrum cordatum]